MILIGDPLCFLGHPLEDGLVLMKEQGFEGVELHHKQLGPLKSDAMCKQLADFISSLGMEVVRTNAAGMDYFVPLTSSGLADRIVEKTKEDINVAAALGVSQFLTWEGRIPPGASRADIEGWIFHETARMFRRIVDHAARRGITVSVEVHPFTLGIDLDWMIKLCDTIGSDFGVTYDCAHFAVGMPKGYIDAIHKLGPRIKHVHFCDSDLVTSEIHFPPGNGCLDLDGIVAALNDVGFNGTMMVDVWLYPLPIAATKTCADYLRNVFEKWEK